MKQKKANSRKSPHCLPPSSILVLIVANTPRSSKLSSSLLPKLSPSAHAPISAAVRRTLLVRNQLLQPSLAAPQRRTFSAKANSNMTGYKPRVIGAPNTREHRVFIEDAAGKVVSPFHDIPLFANEEKTILNMVVEIPRWTNAKLEISKDEPFNPIKQDIKKGKLRYVRNCFPHHGYIWNYGAFPQTWEDPNAVHPDTKAKGDNDPLDVCEIGETVGYTGQIKQVKILGTMALIDEGETDWKIIAIDINDPLAHKLNDMEDVETHLPGLMRATNEWFRIYKIPDDKPENNFAFSGEAKNKKYATEVVHECYEAWHRLIKKEIPNKGEGYDITTVNTNVAESPYKVGTDSAELKAIPAAAPQPPAPIDASIDKWFYLSTYQPKA
ncbi:putative IPP1-inorganic pyrophosphatase [Fimicolochytrium jonesii]|uniref:putative IPP1-inorganic pyrophosphatase n=1 Tax=Fimicolochytrium jonesii TaxID=1396493 RepID=UPI0022FDFF23|nr:putative IPP1-inorganic pyrophosphatase [Fimicolochytrium jonesii]KAI8821732.1 putative IPP1-inorganic pyrophosphatase [Fimicolochytrium jonesii]